VKRLELPDVLCWLSRKRKPPTSSTIMSAHSEMVSSLLFQKRVRAKRLQKRLRWQERFCLLDLEVSKVCPSKAHASSSSRIQSLKGNAHVEVFYEIRILIRNNLPTALFPSKRRRVLYDASSGLYVTQVLFSSFSMHWVQRPERGLGE
jgi:hypothetical protein